MDIDESKLEIVNNAAARQYEVVYKGQTALLQYIERGAQIIYVHTEVPPELEGHGIAGALAKRALDDARAAGLVVVPRCPYVRAYIERHPEYADLVEARV